MSTTHIYLAGPIMGLTGPQANDWRKELHPRLIEKGIIGISPLRCEPLIGERYVAQYVDQKFGTARAIAAKNFFDVKNTAMTLAYLPKEFGLSIGTIMEIAWAFAVGKPVIVVTDNPQVLEHPVVNASANWMLSTLDDALDVIFGILDGYNGGKNV